MTIRTVEVVVEYVAGGWPAERYEGRTRFGMNVAADVGDDDIEAEARARARSIIAKAGCWTPAAVRITALTFA
ncbi:hypothetical protein [Burkholderia multivorans]|uniref:hypothetical protein n=1 Tax=Burkholderia multivorans TaxID=87883 RepID=UPI000AA83179|nr:hypothetical protein [Burkholderia multivorans]